MHFDYLRYYFDVDFYALRIKDNNRVRLDHNYPQTWSDYYEAQNIQVFDPVLLRNNSFFTFWGSQTLDKLQPNQQKLMQAASDFRICSGITFSLSSSNLTKTYLTFASSQDELTFKDQIDKHFTRLFALVFVIQKCLEVDASTTTLKSACHNFDNLTQSERAHKRNQYSQALTRLNIIHYKLKNLLIPTSLKSYLGDQYDILTSELVKAMRINF